MHTQKIGNCLTFSLINRIFNGGQIKCSRIIPFPHFYWTDNNHKSWAYVPLSRIGEKDKFYLDTPIIFEGAPIRFNKRRIL